ncbi:hypothetical protein Landi51_10607 [Colletotrichum acutatum]
MLPAHVQGKVGDWAHWNQPPRTSIKLHLPSPQQSQPGSSHDCFSHLLPPRPASESTDAQFFDTTRLDISNTLTTSPAAAQRTAFLPRQNQAATALDAIIPLFANPENQTTDTHLADVELPGP